MSEDEKNKSYSKILFQKMIENHGQFTYELIEEYLDEFTSPETGFISIDEVLNFSTTFSKNLELVTYKKQKEILDKKSNPKRYVINGKELTRDYYSIRTEVPKILGESAQTLNSRVNKGIIKCIPGFKTKKVSSEEIYNYYLKYLK